jgi:hypothetical protein
MKYGGATMRPRLGVSGRSKRGTFIKWSILLSVLGLLSFYLYVMFATFRGGMLAAPTLSPMLASRR